MGSRLPTILRYGLSGAVVIALASFLIIDLNPSGILDVSYHLCDPSPYVSEFSPHGRVLDIERKNGYCTQTMVIDPVYVDVRLPQQYDRVTIQLRYRKEEGVPLAVGVRTSLDEWQWDIQSAQLQERSKLVTYKDWERASVQFDLTQIPLDRRRVRFMISSPQLDETGKVIELREVHFRFDKPSLSRAMARRWFASFLTNHALWNLAHFS